MFISVNSSAQNSCEMFDRAESVWDTWKDVSNGQWGPSDHRTGGEGMGVFSRMGAVLSAKINALLDRSEDPAETLDYAYERQLEQLHKVKRGIVEVVTSKRRLEMQAAKLESNEAKLVDQAQRAIEAGREDLARIALQRKQLVVTQSDSLRQQIQALEHDQERLALTEQKLVAKVENFRTRKEVIKAQYSAAEAQTRISETVSGLSEEMADVSLLVERAEERTESLQARALAIDELVDTGVLEDSTGARSDFVDRELNKLSAESGVDDELELLKRQLEVKDKKQLEDRA